jgi:hypothetical protein
MIDAAEIMIDEPMSMKAQRFMCAMADAAPHGSVRTTSYAGRHRLLMLYGPGAQRRLPLIARHYDRGGRVAMWDMGYWDHPSMRLSIDTLHPTPAQLALAPDGPGRREFVLREDADPAGPILLIGLGSKSLYAYGLGVMPQQWENHRLRQLQRQFPDTAIVWRPKGKSRTGLKGLPMRHGMPIEDALRGCSLVVVRHSNVAVDACIAGVPVACEAGAALALYGAGSLPPRDERAEFLRRLSWWQWAGDQAAAAWGWINTVCAKDNTLKAAA